MTDRVIMTIDIGNTATKVAVFEGERPVHAIVAVTRGVEYDSASAHGPAAAEAIHTLLTLHCVDGISYCCVGEDRDGIADTLQREGEIPLVMLTPDTPLPIAVEYGTRATLGADRLAAAVGADSDTSSMVVDAGTAVTADIVADHRFLGGNISPGLRLRLRSLNAFTSRLPLVNPSGSLSTFGTDTETAIRAGVVGGLLAELTTEWQEACAMYGKLKMILTGGDAEFLAPLLRQRDVDVEIDPHVVGRGLVRIFNYNIDNNDNANV